MVMRTIEIKEICVKVDKKNKNAILEKLTKLYGNTLKIVYENGMVKVSGDLHNLRKREKIKYILSGGKIGSNI